MGEDFHYRSVIGKLNFWEKSTRIDISYSVHQCAQFSENPIKSHASEVKSIGCYLKGTRDKGLILKPDKLSSFECWVDSDFASISRAGWVIQFAGCPLAWASMMQTITTLSATET